jgi:hypothetical protein
VVETEAAVVAGTEAERREEDIEPASCARKARADKRH